MDKSDLKKILGPIAEMCEIEETPKGFIIRPKVIGHFALLQIYPKIMSLGGEYMLNRSEFFIPKERLEKTRKLKELPLSSLEPFWFTIRVESSMEDQEFNDLLNSVRAYGLIEPLVVRPSKEPNKYEVICGHRRWSAARKANLKTVPCIIVRGMTDAEAFDLALIENIQRRDLTDYEKGRIFKEMLTKFPEIYPDLETLAKRIGKTPSYISRYISHYEFIEQHKRKLSEKLAEKAIFIPERTVREIRKAPIEKQHELLKTTVERYDRGVRNRYKEIKQSIEEAIKSPTANIEVLLEASVEKQAEELREIKEMELKRLEEEREKMWLRLSKFYPDSLLKTVKSHVDPDENEKQVIIFIINFINIMFRKIEELGLTDQIIQEALKK